MSKAVIDGVVPSRCYYYLLEYNDKYTKELMEIIAPECNRLCDLNYEQFWLLFKKATEFECSNR